jgi:hypothetical protein
MAAGNAFKMSLQELRDLMTFRGIEGVNKVRLVRADIQGRGSILAWIVISSLYGADTIAIDLFLSVLIS